MSDRIQLLPDNIANQIAAGEVIQRPASVVKELLENSIDAGATSIKVLIKNAGKTLIQIIDNGCGMSETDARMCFEKHATSKIRSADDLFNILTMGFRGEALASVAAIAQVELKTRQHDAEIGTQIEIEGMKVLRQEPCQTEAGTNFAVKNLFFNVPARRNFLKSDNVERGHIIDEVNRVALANSKIAFQLFSDDEKMLHYNSGNLKQRICAVFDTKYETQIVPVEENTAGLNIYGFAGKPSLAKKKNEPFVFVNKRYIKSNYINHAVKNAFDQMISPDYFPFYVLFIDIDPKRIDVNVHPQKYEVKFEDEKLIYTFVNLAVKHALGAHSVMPSLDFNQEDSLNKYNTFGQQNSWLVEQLQPAVKTDKKFAHDFHAPTISSEKRPQENWQQLFETRSSRAWDSQSKSEETQAENLFGEEQKEVAEPYQLHQKYIVSPIRSGFILIDQQAAHERILYEQYIRQMALAHPASQQQLFPVTLEFLASDAQILSEILPDIQALGFDISEFGTNAFVVHAFPADVNVHNERQIFEELIEQYKNNSTVTKFSKRENLAKSLAASTAIRRGQNLSVAEMKTLIDELFACENAYTAPNGKPTFVTINFEKIEELFGK